MPEKATSPLVRHLPLTKFRSQLGKVIRRVHRDKEYVVLERDGMPVAAIMDIDEFEDYLELSDPVVQHEIELSREDFEAGRVGDADELSKELHGIATKASPDR